MASHRRHALVEHDARQRTTYLRFRDLLRSGPDSRERDERVKLRLAAEVADDRRAYTGGKSAVIARIMSEG